MTIGASLAAAAAGNPEKTAFICEGRELTYGEADIAANRFANALIDRGVGRGDRVAVIAHNSLEYAVTYFGIARAGGVSLHLSARLAPDEIAHCLDRGEVVAALCDPELADVVSSTGRRLSVVSTGRDDFAAFLEAGAPEDPGREQSPDTPSSATYTGGTTGFPKGGLHTARSRLKWAEIAVDWFGLGSSEVMAVAAPMSHAAGGFIWFQPGVCVAATQVLLPKWDVPAFLAAAERSRVTATFLVPTQIALLLDHEAFEPARLSGLRKIVYGGAPAPPGLIERAAETLPRCEFIQNYGMTEIGPLVTLYREDRDRHPGALGRPSPKIECAVYAAPGSEAEPGEVGELCFRGETLMQGYVGGPEQTQAFFRGGDGWGWTGDLATRDETGLLTLVGRSGDMINSGGLNIHPAEIERVLLEMPEIDDCAVFAVPDPVFGELPVAAVVAADPSVKIAAEALLEDCAGRIARHKRPRRIIFVNEIPKNAAGKILRARLHDRYAG